MSSTLARSAFRIARYAPRTRIAPAPRLRSLHSSVRIWEEAKTAVQERPSTIASTEATATSAQPTSDPIPTPTLADGVTKDLANQPVPPPTEAPAMATEPETSTSTAASEGVTEAEASEASLMPIEAWKRSGVHPAVAERLVANFPDIVAPTPAQLAYLLTIQRGQADVYLKDDMGRGKTFATVLAALSLALSGKKVLVLVPTPHLMRQVEELLTRLSPDPTLWTSLSKDSAFADVTQAVCVATPKSYLTSRAKVFPDWILVDEPEAMLGPLPPRHADAARLAHHPLFKHPPPAIDVLNRLFGIRPARRFDPRTGKYKREQGRIDVDLSRRRDIRTAWTSAALQAKTKSFVFRRGWARGAADLNWAPGASDRQREIRDNMECIGQGVGGVTAGAQTRRPDHYAIEVAPTGALRPLPPTTAPSTEAKAKASAEASTEAPAESSEEPLSEEGAAPRQSPVFTEAVALLQTLAPPPRGTYSLLLPPAGQSLAALAEELAELGVPCAPLVPEAIAAGVPPPEDGEDGAAPPVLIASRESLTGLHLPDLHTVYLVNGVDVGGLSANQRRFGGRGERLALYARVAGRLGRLGTRKLGKPQRVISLLPQGAYEREALLAAVADMGETLDAWTDVDLASL